MAGELTEQFSFRVPEGTRAVFIANATSMGSSDQIVLRELVRAFNDYCATGRRPTFPFDLSSPGYIVEEGRVIDATQPPPTKKTPQPYPTRPARPKSA